LSYNFKSLLEAPFCLHQFSVAAELAKASNAEGRLRPNGTRLQHLELLRKNAAYLDAIGADSIPDPTTAGDFCRRFGQADIDALLLAINETRLNVWKRV
jgi:hypothetical protein